MPRVTARNLGRFTKKNQARKRASVTTRARYAPKTARANRALIKSNAWALKRLKQQIPGPIITDYQYRFQTFGNPSTVDNGPEFSIAQFPLTNFQQWAPVMRESNVVINKSQTTIYRLTWNIRYQLNNAYWAQFTIFICTLRKDFSNRTAAGQPVLQAGGDYIVDSDNYNPSLNPGIWNVMYTRNVTLSRGAFSQRPTAIGPGQANDIVSNAATTWKTGRITMKKRMKVRVPVTNTNWRVLPFQQLPYYQQLYCLVFINTASAANETGVVAQVNVNQWASCINSA